MFLVVIIRVVYYHLNMSHFHMGLGYISPKELTAFLNERNLMHLVVELVHGIGGVVGVLFINSGYGLAKSRKLTTIGHFYKERFYKIYLYALCCALVCTLIAFVIEKQLAVSYWTSFIPVFGFYSKIERHFPVTQYWFLANIFVFYLIFPFIKKRFSNTLYIAIVILSLAYAFLSSYVWKFSFIDNYHSTVVRFAEFATGIFLARNAKWERFVFTPSIKALLLGLASFILGYVCLYLKYVNIGVYLFTSIGTYLILSQIALLLQRSNRVVRIIKTLSAGTFTLYLLHMVTVRYGYRLYLHTIYDALDNFNGYVSFVFSAVVIVFLSVIILLLGDIVEKKYRAFIAKKLQRA